MYQPPGERLPGRARARAGKRDYLQCQQPNAFQRFIGVHFNFLRSGKNFKVLDVLASQIRALGRQADRVALTSRTKKRAFFWGASGLTLMVLAILNACKRGKCSAAREAPCVKGKCTLLRGQPQPEHLLQHPSQTAEALIMRETGFKSHTKKRLRKQSG